MEADRNSEWRIDNAQHLRSARLKFQPYVRWSAAWDHDHCAACWARFAEADGPGFLHAGYATCDDYRHGARYEWVCAKCFADLEAEMGWSVADA